MKNTKDSNAASRSLHRRVRRFTACGDDGCGECDVCKYLSFIDYAEGCAPPGSVITRNPRIELYLKLSEADRRTSDMAKDVSAPNDQDQGSAPAKPR